MTNNALFKMSSIIFPLLLSACGEQTELDSSAAEAPQLAHAEQAVTFSPQAELIEGISIVMQPEKGQLVDNRDGTFTFEPGDDFLTLGAKENIELTYKYNYGGKTFTRVIKVSGYNNKPMSESFTIRQALDTGVISGQLKVRDLDSNDSHHFSIITPPDFGSVTISPHGRFVFTANQQFPPLKEGDTKELSFTYVAVDNSGSRNSNTSPPSKVTLMVTGGDFGDNTRPQAADVNLPGSTADSPITGHFDISDADKDSTLTVQLMTQPEKGTVKLNDDASFTYIPGNDFDSLLLSQIEEVTFTYQAVDSSSYANAHSEIKTVTIPIIGSLIQENKQALMQDLALTIDLAHATQVQGQLSSSGEITEPPSGFTLLSAPEKGSLISEQDGHFTYFPGDDFEQLATGDTQELQFFYIATDHTSLPGRVSIKVTGANASSKSNHQPLVQAQTYSLAADASPFSEPFIVRDLDANNKHRFILDESLSHGLVTSSNGRFIFDPLNDFDDLAFGQQRQVSFKVTAIDDANAANSKSVSAKITLNVTGVNHASVITGTPPTSLQQGINYYFSPSVSDENPSDTHKYSIVNKPAWASFDSNTGVLSGIAHNDVTGTSDGITISVSDGKFSDSLPAFSIKIIDVDLAPVAAPFLDSTDENAIYYGKLTASDNDGNLDTNSYTLVSGVSKGRLSLNTDGSFEFDPLSNFNDMLASDPPQSISFTYRVSDLLGNTSEIATATINVTGSDDKNMTLVAKRLPRTEGGFSYNFSSYSPSNDNSGDLLISVAIANDPDTRSHSRFGFYFADTNGNPTAADPASYINAKLLINDTYNAAGSPAKAKIYTASIEESKIPKSAVEIGFFLIPDDDNAMLALPNQGELEFELTADGWEAYIIDSGVRQLMLTAKAEEGRISTAACDKTSTSPLIFSTSSLNEQYLCNETSLKTVHLSGDFNNWAEEPMYFNKKSTFNEQSKIRWSRKLYIADDTSPIKFKLDGTWCGDNDSDGKVNCDGDEIAGLFSSGVGTYEIYIDDNATSAPYYVTFLGNEEAGASPPSDNHETRDEAIVNDSDGFIFADIANMNAENNIYLSYHILAGKLAASELDEKWEGNNLGQQVDDIIDAKAGNDIIISKSGNDIMNGGDGDDLFIWGDDDAGLITLPDNDIILDFDVRADGDDDSLDLSALFKGTNCSTLSDCISISIGKDVLASSSGLKQGDTVLKISPDGNPSNVTLTITLQNWGLGNSAVPAAQGSSDWSRLYPGLWLDMNDSLANPGKLLEKLIEQHHLFITAR